MNNLIRWNEPRFDETDIHAVTKALRDNYVNEGPRTEDLESRLESYLQVKHATMTANGTAALFLAIKADTILRERKDFEVIVPDITMIATATAVGWAGGKPVMVDVEEDRLTIDVKKIEKKITKKTTAIIPVHVLGRAVAMDSLEKIANERGLTIIEDAAGALGSKYNGGKYLGTMGKVGCFSLQSNKIITSGQGGFVTTDDDEYYETMRRLRDFGRFSNREFTHETEGYNLKFSDLAAALALGQFEKIDVRRGLLVGQRKKYEDELGQVGELIFPEVMYARGEVPLWVDVLAEKRDELSSWLKERRIATRNYWPAVHRNPPYMGQFTDQDFPVASKVSDAGLWLPNGPAVSDGDIKRVCDEIKGFYSNGKK